MARGHDAKAWIVILATVLELGILFVVLTSGDPRTRIVGALVWCAYLYYSATLCSLRALARWVDDRTNPPGGTA